MYLSLSFLVLQFTFLGDFDVVYQFRLFWKKKDRRLCCWTNFAYFFAFNILLVTICYRSLQAFLLTLTFFLTN